jgi:hypothetical protein
MRLQPRSLISRDEAPASFSNISISRDEAPASSRVGGGSASRHLSRRRPIELGQETIFGYITDSE